MQQALTRPTPPLLDQLRSLLDGDWEAVNVRIREALASDVALVNQVGHYIVGSGGKRLRPLVVLLSARACGYIGDRHIDAAAVIEFIHTATLLHDDVVDESSLRRGRDTANHVWGNQASVLVGDFLYSRAFQLMVGLDDVRIMRVMADATNVIAAGEVLQLMNIHDPGTTEARYRDVIYRKTAKLFEAGAQIAGLVAGVDEPTERALADYGKHLGQAFQLIDDALDYRSSAEEMGKNVGDDLAEGKPTLPLIHALEHGSEEERRLIADAIATGGLEHIDAIQRAIESTGALDYTLAAARSEAAAAENALEALPDSAFTDALVRIAQFAVDRRA